MNCHLISTDIGRLLLCAENDTLVRIERLPDDTDSPSDDCTCPVLIEAERQLKEYICGERNSFDLPIKIAGTPFQMQVLDAVSKIPYGETRSYGQLCESIGNPKAARALGSAIHRNPLPLIIPCHRVIAANGKLGGFVWGTDVKRRLLQLERQ